MSARLLTHLRHVDLAVPDYDKQLDFYAGVWGLTKVAEDSGISFLAAEGSPEQYVVRLRKAEEKRLDLVSYGAASPADVDTLAEQLLAGGVQLLSQPGKVDTPEAATASASSTSTAAPSRSPPTSRPGSTAGSRRRSRSRSG